MYRNGRSYYSVAGIEAEEVIDGMNMLHREGAAVKYLFRCNNILPKGEVLEDLKKCRHYISRCLQFSPPPFRENNAAFYIDRINIDAFSPEIYNALYEILSGVGDATANYQECMESALDFINDALERY